MMGTGVGLFLPVTLVAALGWGTVVVAGRRHPVAASRSTLTVLVVAAAATVPLVAHLVVAAVLEIPRLGAAIHGGIHPGAHRSATAPWVSTMGVAWALMIVVRAATLVRRYRRECGISPGGLRVIRDDRPAAYVLPGVAPTVVVSDGLVHSLKPAELDAVLAHENAHATMRHGRLLFVARMCDAIAPYLRPVTRRYEFFLERIADEHAARVCGDRLLVARALARTAVARESLVFAPSIGGSGVVARVDALREVPSRAPSWLVAASGAGVAGVAVFGAVQWHHVAVAIRLVCGF